MEAMEESPVQLWLRENAWAWRDIETIAFGPPFPSLPCRHRRHRRHRRRWRTKERFTWRDIS